MRIEGELKTKSIKDDYQKLYLNIIFTSNYLEDQTAHIFKSVGITKHQYNVLRILRGSQNTPLPAFEIQNRMIAKSSNVTRIIEKLVLKEMVHKKFNDSNRRMVEITITDKGLALLRDLDGVIEECYTNLFGNISREEAHNCSDFLDKIRG